MRGRQWQQFVLFSVVCRPIGLTAKGPLDPSNSRNNEVEETVEETDFQLAFKSNWYVLFSSTGSCDKLLVFVTMPFYLLNLIFMRRHVVENSSFTGQ